MSRWWGAATLCEHPVCAHPRVRQHGNSNAKTACAQGNPLGERVTAAEQLCLTCVSPDSYSGACRRTAGSDGNAPYAHDTDRPNPGVLGL